MYCNIYLDKEKGPDQAKSWAYKLGFKPDGIKVLAPYIKEEFARRGFTSS